MRGFLRSLGFAILFLSLLTEGFGQSLFAIGTIQGADNSSPLTGTFVNIDTAVVTARGTDFFVIQTPAGREDDDPQTSEALFVQHNANVSVAIGQLVLVAGTIREIDEQTSVTSPNLSIQPLNASTALPPPLPLGNNFPSPDPDVVPDLERVEGMRVAVTAMVTSPSSDFGTAYLTAAPQRPFREPGIEWPGLSNLPVWDGNPEIFRFDPDALQAPDNRLLSAGATLTATGIIRQDGQYFFLPESYAIDNPDPRRPVRAATAAEITVASLNALRLGPEFPDYGPRLAKTVRYLSELLRFPDVIALQEIGSASVLDALGFRLEQLRPDRRYRSYYLAGSGDIHTGFLVREGLGTATVRQLGKDDLLSTGGRLFSRPPLLLELSLANASGTELQIMNLHLRSLIGIEGSNASFVRQLRYEQSLAVAEMVDDLAAGNLLVVGDFNAFEFTDGYVDVVNQIAGQPSQGALLSWQDVVDHPLQVLTNTLPANERYSYIFRGSSQTLDHALLSETLTGITFSEMQFARGNADAAEVYFEQSNTSLRASDHDGFVVFLAIDDPITTTNTPADDASLHLRGPNPVVAGGTLYLDHRPGPVVYQWFDALGRLIARGQAIDTVSVPAQLTPGTYWLRCQDASGDLRTFKIHCTQ
jgi:endonuclease/exonuclease/phosphatase family metal-dependent hydrolase